MATSPPEQAVLYIDVLGFAALTLNSEETPVRVPPYETGIWQDDYGAGSHFWTEKSPISNRLLVFHRRLEDVLHKATRQGELQAMLFSDGAFVVTRNVQRLALLAGEIMRVCIIWGTPVRMGIAVGTFQPLKFAAETVGDTGIYTSLFYGTGVVKAHYAEQQGGRGMRIFVHPSVIAALPDEFDGITSASFERTKYHFLPLATPSQHASHEFEYLHRQNPVGWHNPRPDTSHNEDQKLWDSVKQMQSRAPIDDAAAQLHYSETLAALNKMTISIGRAAFADVAASE